VLTANLVNEIDEIERDFVVVLEDYHTIHKQEIHDLLTVLLQPPARHMHLVLITRKDPPLAKGVLLARNQMTEIRQQGSRTAGSGAQSQCNRLPDGRGACADVACHRGFSPEDCDSRPDVRPVVRDTAWGRCAGRV
jgi:hypothetical protein